jgi:hypothetical protein
MALGLWALANYVVLSLVSHDTGCAPNLGGALGEALARILEHAFAYRAYVLALLLACLGQSAWTAASIGMLLRYTAGGLILLAALSMVGDLGKIAVVPPGRATGSMIAAALPAYFHLGRLNLIVLLAIVGALAVLARRAPAEMVVSSTLPLAPARPSAGTKEPDNWLPHRARKVNGVPNLGRVRSSASAPHTAEPSLIVLAEKARVRPAWMKRAYRLPRLELLDNPPLDNRRRMQWRSNKADGYWNRSWWDLAYRRRYSQYNPALSSPCTN